MERRKERCRGPRRELRPRERSGSWERLRERGEGADPQHDQWRLLRCDRRDGDSRPLERAELRYLAQQRRCAEALACG